VNLILSMFREIFLKERKFCEPYNNFGVKTIIFFERLVILVVSGVCHSWYDGQTYTVAILVQVITLTGRCQWPRGLRRRSAAVRSLGLRVRIPPGAWEFVCCECCVLSGRGLCDGPFTISGVLPNVVFLSVISKPQRWGLAPLRLPTYKNNSQKMLFCAFITVTSLIMSFMILFHDPLG